MPFKIKSYTQDDIPRDILRARPHEKWRCDIFPSDGSDHHGIGETEAEAVFNAATAWRRYNGEKI